VKRTSRATHGLGTRESQALPRQCAYAAPPPRPSSNPSLCKRDGIRMHVLARVAAATCPCRGPLIATIDPSGLGNVMLDGFVL
jgi:hypothetical protein